MPKKGSHLKVQQKQGGQQEHQHLPLHMAIHFQGHLHKVQWQIERKRARDCCRKIVALYTCMERKEQTNWWAVVIIFGIKMLDVLKKLILSEQCISIWINFQVLKITNYGVLLMVFHISLDHNSRPLLSQRLQLWDDMSSFISHLLGWRPITVAM